MRAFILGTVAMLFVWTIASQQIADKCEQHATAIITGISGNCSLRKGDKLVGNALTAKNCSGTKLTAGQKLQCTSGSYVRLFFCNSKREIEIKGNPQKWYTVPNVPASVPAEGETEIKGRKRPRERVAEYFSIPTYQQLVEVDTAASAGPARMAGSSARALENGNSRTAEFSKDDKRTGSAKGISVASAASTTTSLQLASPCHSGKIWSNHLIVRWQPVSNESTLLALSILTPERRVLWTQNVVDGRSGQFTSDVATAELQKFRATNPKSKVIFSVAGDDGVLRECPISLLPREDEEPLKQDLSEIAEEQGFLLHIYRADAFHRRQLYSEEAEEYEILLSSSPESEDLLVGAMIAHCRANNVARVAELARQLSPNHPYSWSFCRLQ